jgi:hypothetical protein
MAFRAIGHEWAGKVPQSLNGANPYPVPTPSRWHPPPATGHADSSGEDWEVVSVPEVVEVIKAGEVASWKERAMVEPMHASPSASHAKVVWAAEAVHAARSVHAAEAVASHAAHHRVGRHHWRGKHRHHDSTSDCYFAEHDNPPDCHRSPRVIVRTQCKRVK